MADITGSRIEIAPLVRFLVSMGKSGDVLVWHSQWCGQLSLDRGRLTAAAIEDEQGVTALEFIAGALDGGDFEFFEGQPTLSPNLDLGADPLVDLERSQTAGRLPRFADLCTPISVPRVVGAHDLAADVVPLQLRRDTVYVLLEVDGRRTVRDIAGKHGFVRTLTSLNRLRELGLVGFEPDASGHDSPTDASDQQPATPEAAVRGTPRLSARLRFWPRRVAHRGQSLARSEIVQAVLATGLVILGVRSVIQNFRVEGVSMQPTFDGGQVLVVNRAAYFHVEQTALARVLPTSLQGSTRYVFGGPQRGDIAVFRAPVEPDTDYIKRVIGLPGDTVLIQRGQVFVNGQPLDEPYIRFPATYNFPIDANPLVVPDRNYFVLGDNRPDSFDSHFGWLVPVDELIGRAWIRYWPPDDVTIVAPGTQALAKAAVDEASHGPEPTPR